MVTPSTSPLDAMMSFGKFVPGFEFLQGLVNNAEKALPSIGQWVAPTLDPAELDKRINDLKAVQFWLDQNGRMLATTIQALEVQKMTLSTLRTMNVSLSDLQSAVAGSGKSAAAPAPTPAPAPRAAAEPAPAARKAGATANGKAAATAQPAVDAMEWWGALSKQFTHLAQAAMTDTFKGPGGRGLSTPASPEAGPVRKTKPSGTARKTAPRKRS